MVTCNSDGQRCAASRFVRSFYRTKQGELTWVDSSVQCLNCGAGWVERFDEPLP